MRKPDFFILVASLLFLLHSGPLTGASSGESSESELHSVTGKLTLIETHFLSTTIQVKKIGKKGGLRSVMAIVNSKTLIRYNGKDILLKDIPLQSTVLLEYERVKGVIVARSVLVKRLYSKPVPKTKRPVNK